MKKIIAITAVSTVALFMGAQSALAGGGHHGFGGNVVVKNHNVATVTNTVSAVADTGGSEATGGDTEDAGNGGSVYCSDDNNTGGNGGNSGDAGHGGTIFTGSALASAYADNTVNINNTKVVGTCGRCGKGKVIVRNTNYATVRNTVDADANTGGEDADGGDAGGAGTGGSVNHSDDGNTGGRGGNGGNGGNGGYIITGPATSYADAINVVNRNVTRIRR